MKLRDVDWFRTLVILGAAAVSIALMLWLGRAFAADAKLDWTAPTQREDGTALAANQIAGYDLEWGKCGQAQQTLRVGAVTTHTITGLAYGEWCFRVRTVDTTGLLSAWAGPVQKVILAPPKPPVFTTVAIVVYDLRWNAGRGTVLNAAVGTVPVGTACGESEITRQGQRRFHEVPLDVVELRSLPLSAIVVAQCEVQS